ALLQESGEGADNIPRNQRKRAYIDSVRIMYVPSTKSPGAASSSNQGMGPDFDINNLQNYGMQQEAKEQTKSVDATFFGKDFKLNTFWQSATNNNSTNTNSGDSGTKKVTAKQDLQEHGPRLVITLI